MGDRGKAGTDGRASLLDRLYDTALDPARYQALVEAWEEEAWHTGDARDYSALGRLDGHLVRACDLLARAGFVPEAGGADQAPPPDLYAQMTLAPGGLIEAQNPAAELRFGALAGWPVAELPLPPAILHRLAAEAARLARAPKGTAALLRLECGAPPRQTVVRLTAGREAAPPRTVHLRFADPSWPPALDLELGRLYGLTPAEAEVSRSIAEGLSVGEIAAVRGRRILTVRAQMRAILRKTDARNQSDLVRMVFALLPLLAGTAPSPGVRANEWQTHALGDGRRLCFMVLGDPRGRPFLWLPSAMGIYRLTAAMEADLARLGLAMIVPARAGYGGSSPQPAGEPAFAVAARDLASLCAHLGHGRIPVVSVGQDLCAAVHLAARAPGLVSSIFACAPVLPALERRHFERMNTLQRFVAANARHAPAALPFVVRAGFAMARRLGKRRFARAAFGNCQADAAALARPDILEALVLGSEAVLSEHFSAHDAFAAETRELNTDWSPLLEGFAAPIVFFAGHEDAEAPIATLREFAPRLKRLALVGCPGEGRLAIFTKWPQLLALIRAAAQ